MNDQALDEMVARSARYDDAAVPALGLRGAQRELLEEILATPVEHREATVRTLPRRRRAAVLGAVAATVALVVAVPVWLSAHHARPGQPPPAAAQPRKVSTGSANPYVLLDAPGWKVDYVEEQGRDSGDVTFAKGKASLRVTWYPARSYSGYHESRSQLGRATSVQVLGRAGEMHRYTASDFTTILPPDGATFLEIRGHGAARTAYVGLLGMLEQVAEEQWSGAMPSSVVQPDTQQSVAEEMLTGVPLPPGFDRAALTTGRSDDYYQYGAEVAGSVACGWIKDWVDATGDGNTVEAQRAVAAMNTSRSWAVLKKMAPDGGYPEVLWQYADLISAGQQPKGYEGALGCG